ncbi:MAG: phosphotransferase, partial [Planctomycetota bacterium]
LHDVPATDAAGYGAPPDRLRRLDVPYRAPRILDRLERLVASGCVQDAASCRRIIHDTPRNRRLSTSTLVHGDLYVRHLLVDSAGQLRGVIDWGDAHLGDAAVDLSIAHSFLPPSAHDAFRLAYGSIDEGAWALARFRALHLAVVLLSYGHDIQDSDLVREGRTALRYLVGS